MDRDAFFAILFTTFVTGFAAAFYFASSADAPSTPLTRTAITYSPDDVRYRFQQEELRELQRKARIAKSAGTTAPTEDEAPAAITVEDEPESEVGEPPAEEPSIR